MQTEKKKLGLFRAINCREDALKIVKEAAYFFYFIAGMQIIAGLIVKIPTVLDGAAYLILGVLLQKYKSQIVAVILLVMSLFSFVVTLLSKMGIINLGGTNIILALIVVIVAARSVYATFKLYSKYREAS